MPADQFQTWLQANLSGNYEQYIETQANSYRQSLAEINELVYPNKVWFVDPVVIVCQWCKGPISTSNCKSCGGSTP